MNNKLVLHPSAHASAAAKLRVSASAEVVSGGLILKYRIESPSGAPKLIWPEPTSKSSLLKATDRKDELWKNTCLEAFLLFLDGSYIELNFSPDGFWNAYCFDSYRKGMQTENRIAQVTDFKSTKSGDADNTIYELSIKLNLEGAVRSPQHFRLGLTSVIETVGGERSYWSLKHSGEKPDFHDSRGHILEMRI